MNSIGELLSWAITQLNDDQANTDAQALLAHITGHDRSWLFAWPEKTLDSASVDSYKSLIQQRAAGKPVAYLTGTRGFWTLDLTVSPDTLIPRPESEHLVERVLKIGNDDQAFHVLDLGTGSGAIALAIARERPHWQVTAVDFSQAALKIAEQNAISHNIRNVNFLHSDWFKQVTGSFDLIVSNPPYIAEKDRHLCQGDLRFEPRNALASGLDGLDDIRLICEQAFNYLKPGAWLIFEHGLNQGQRCRDLLNKKKYQHVFTERDLAGLDRISGGQNK